MNWTQITISVSKEGIEPVCTVLNELGITGIQIEDTSDVLEYGKYWDYIEQDLLDKQNKTSVKIYTLDANLVKAVEQSMSELKAADTEKLFGLLECAEETIDDEDWAENWKKHFKPFEVGEHLYIKPEWEQVEVEAVGNRKILNINPGMSFGTGTHETTKMCLELIEQHMRQDMSILDIGCGSGILSVGGLLLGGRSALAVDIDPNAVKTARENADLNKIPQSKYSTAVGDILKDLKIEGKYDMIVANIIADVIIGITPCVKDRLEAGGFFICSGIINTREQDVINYLTEHNFKIEQIKRENDWVAICAMLFPI